MRAPRRSSDWSSRVRFSGSESGAAHGAWYRAIAEHYGMLYAPNRDAAAAEYLDQLFRRHGGVTDVLDVACGTFGIDLGLARRGYRIVGRDLSPEMVRVARQALGREGPMAEVGVGDMRSLRLGRQFDCVLCLGTAFNYLVSATDARQALRSFHAHLRPGGLLVLDLTNFEAFIGNPMNARAEVDYTTPDGARFAVFAFNAQNPSKTVHVARFLTVAQRGRQIDIRFDEAPLKIWRRDAISGALQASGFRVIEWSGDLKVKTPFRPQRSDRLVAIAVRPDAGGALHGRDRARLRGLTLET